MGIHRHIQFFAKINIQQAKKLLKYTTIINKENNPEVYEILENG